MESLSHTTSAFGRGAKFAAYRKLPTLHEYALIDPVRLSLDLFRRKGDGKHWVLHPIDAGDQVTWARGGPAIAARVPVRRRCRKGRRGRGANIVAPTPANRHNAGIVAARKTSDLIPLCHLMAWHKLLTNLKLLAYAWRALAANFAQLPWKRWGKPT